MEVVPWPIRCHNSPILISSCDFAMLDRKLIVDNLQLVKQNCENRGARADVDHLVELETTRRDKGQEVQELNRRANEVSKSIGTAKDAAEREARKQQGRQLRQQKDAAQQQHDQLEQQILEIQRTIPNLSHPDAPVGVDDKANSELRRGAHGIPQFDFAPQDHVALGEQLDLIDFEGGARTTGARVLLPEE